MKIDLPSELENYRPQLETSKKSFFKISTTKDSSSNAFKSKIGGCPYLPKGKPYPKGENDKPLEFLSQINFSEIPENDIYPNEGILQFFIGFDDLHGLDLDFKNRENYRVIFYESLEEETETDFHFLDKARKIGVSPLSHDNVLKMSFEKSSEYVSATDYEFEKYFGASFYDFFENFDENADELGEFYFNEISQNGHKLGGYANFTQEDPRSYSAELGEEYELLFQLDSDEDIDEICWGDAGIGNFFIKRSDLIKRDFSKVIFNWDCS